MEFIPSEYQNLLTLIQVSESYEEYISLKGTEGGIDEMTEYLSLRSAIRSCEKVNDGIIADENKQ